MGIMRWQKDNTIAQNNSKDDKREELERLAAEEEGNLLALMQLLTDMLLLALMGQGSAALLKGLNCKKWYYTAREPNKEEQYEQDMMEMAAEEDMEDGDEDGGSGHQILHDINMTIICSFRH